MRFFNELKKSKWLNLSLTLIIVCIIVRASIELLPKCSFLPDVLSPFFLLAIGIAWSYRVVNAYGWVLVLRGMGFDVDGLHATRIWLIAESRRWLPGGIWGYASRANMASELDISAGPASTSMLFELLLTVVAAAITSLPYFLVYDDQLATIPSLCTSEHWTLIWTGCVLTLTTVLLLPWTRRRLLRIVIRVFNKTKQLAFRNVVPLRMLVALAYLVGMGVMNGFATYGLALSLDLPVDPPLTAIVAATSFSWIVGLVTVVAPGGLFVREATFAACMSFWMPYPMGLALAVLARLVQLSAELFGMVWARWVSNAPIVSTTTNMTVQP